MEPLKDPTPAKSARRRLWERIGIVVFICLAAAAGLSRLVIARAEPILRTRVIQTLATRFNSKVELESFHVSVINGIEVSGGGLKLYGKQDPNPYEQGIQPLIAIQQFRFQSALRSLFRTPMHVDTVYVKGLELNIPPKGNRGEMTKMQSRTGKMTIFVDKFVCEDTKLVINTSVANKPPLEFAIASLKMKDIGTGEPLHFDATLTNPKPVGNIQSSGLFGPWQQDDPRDTPVQGDYSFNHADLSTIKGIGGILSSTGVYEGTLGSIVVTGKTDTPDFRIAISGHPVPLHTDFHAIVDGTTGDTYLKPVRASFLHTSFTANGSIVRVNQADLHGHDIELDVVLDHAEIEDLLKLGVRTDPSIMTGAVEMKTHMSLPPGQENVENKIKLAGDFHVPAGHFTNEKVQSKLDSLSLRTQGKVKDAQNSASKDAQNVPVDLQGKYTLNDGVFSFSFLHFLVPGTHVDMTGNYSLDGKQFDFRGKARLEATLSQMTTGWKSILLRPVDPFFKKDGAGTEVPIRITGTESEPHFGLDFRHKDERPSAGASADAGSKKQ